MLEAYFRKIIKLFASPASNPPSNNPYDLPEPEFIKWFQENMDKIGREKSLPANLAAVSFTIALAKYREYQEKKDASSKN